MRGWNSFRSSFYERCGQCHLVAAPYTHHPESGWGVRLCLCLRGEGYVVVERGGVTWVEVFNQHRPCLVSGLSLSPEEKDFFSLL